MVTAYLVRGEGVNPVGAEHLATAFKHQAQDSVLGDISEIKRHLKSRLDTPAQNVMVVPGGSSLTIGYNLTKNDSGRWLKDFVSQGGGYLGVCAGANVGSTSILYQYETSRLGSISISDIPTLAFLPVTAFGPAFEEFTTQPMMDPKKSILATLTTAEGQRAAYNCHGAYFVPRRGGKVSVDVVARYDESAENKPAIVRGQFGQGGVVLSGVHAELNPTDAAETSEQTAQREQLMGELVKLFVAGTDMRDK